jgi:eukaryotic-like serine/threonine-protein kinase
MASDTTAPPHLGNFDIVSKIADGGMGTVYKARHRATGRIVAIKVLAPTTARNPTLLKRFQQEFEAAKVLDHPNVVRALEYYGNVADPFLVMEFVDGESLGQRMERSGAVPEAEAIKIIAQVCEGLQRAHKQGLVHRDVKPDNILVTKDGVAKLTDLGLVKDVEGELNLTKTGRGLGTPHFMAPEQFRNAKTVDVRGDIYSLGATLYAIVTGTVPFGNAKPLDCWMKKIRNEFPPPKDLNRNLSDRVDWAIRRAMSAEPDRRPASCREFLEDLTGQSRTTPTRLGQPVSVTPRPDDIWYMVYKDETGESHTVRGTTDGIRNALANQLLGDAAMILVSRSKTGHFQSLPCVAEFRDLVVHPAQLPSAPAAKLSGVVGRASGSMPMPTERRKPDEPDAVNGGPPPSGSIAAAAMRRPPTPLPGVHASPPVNRQTPTMSESMQRTHPAPALTIPVEAPADSNAETELYGEAIDSKAELAPRNPFPTPTSSPVRQVPAAPRDWVPFYLLVIMLLAATVAFLLLERFGVIALGPAVQ